MSYSIRTASLKDIPAIENIYPYLYEVMHNVQPEYYRIRQQEMSFFREMIVKSDGEIFVAEDKNGGMLGLALLEKQETAIDEPKYAILIDLMVHPTFRQQGIGNSLLDACTAWSKAKKLSYIELDVLEEHKDAIRLYQEKGYKDASRIMRLEL